MKVTLPKDYRKRFTLEQVDIARRIIRDMKEDESTPAEYIRYAVRDYFKHFSETEYDIIEEVLKAEAKVEGNCRAWDAYGVGTEHMDIWVDATVRTSNGFLIIGAYMTDIWSISPKDSRADHYYTRYFKEVKL